MLLSMYLPKQVKDMQENPFSIGYRRTCWCNLIGLVEQMLCRYSRILLKRAKIGNARRSWDIKMMVDAGGMIFQRCGWKNSRMYDFLWNFQWFRKPSDYDHGWFPNYWSEWFNTIRMVSAWNQWDSEADLRWLTFDTDCFRTMSIWFQFIDQYFLVYGCG